MTCNERWTICAIGQLKHATQKTYNNGKWGLDKCTENWHKVQLETNVPLEPKYVLRMFDGIVANVWKFEQGRSLVRPYCASYRAQHGSSPSLAQI